MRVYIFINIIVSIFALGREVYVRAKAWNAADVLFHELVSGVLYSPMSFFDSTPLGINTTTTSNTSTNTNTNINTNTNT